MRHPRSADGWAIGRGQHEADGTDRLRPAPDHCRTDGLRRPESAAALGSIQGGSGLLRQGHARPRRRDAAVVRRQLGQHPQTPTPEERNRGGGAGVYYHFDYVGDPRNYKWIDTNPIPKIWEQMNLALKYGEDTVWSVNVGDLKPMEFPTDFFLSFARDP